MMNNFIPLHVYSGNSFLKSGLTIARYLQAIKKRNFKWAGLSDFQTLSSAPEFYLGLKKLGISPIIGEDFLIEDYLFSFYVKNENGYLNLLKIHYQNSCGQLKLGQIKDLTKDLIIVIKTRNFNFKNDGLNLIIRDLTNLGQEVYLGLDYGYDILERETIREFAKKYNYPLLAFPFIRYEKKEDAITLKIVEAIDKEETLKEKEEEGEEYLLSDLDLENYYLEEEIANLKIFQTIDFSLIIKRGNLIHYQNNEGLSSDEYLRKITFDNLKERGLDNDKYRARLNEELDVIISMGYSDYFLLVSDYVNYAKKHGIVVGPGRGSAAGSLVSYCLNITIADPLKYNLLFERFLNKDRRSMPDIDVDFSDVRRYQVIDYLKEKYGKTHVANILTLQTIGAKQSLRDIGRIYNYETREIDLISKLIIDSSLSLRDNYRKNEQFRKLIDSDKYYLNIVALASKIEGLPRQRGLHAAGVILNDAPLENVLPCINDENNMLISEYQMDYLQDQGFLKMDILGIRNLTIIQECLTRVEEDKGIKLDYYALPYEDEKAIELIHDGLTMGIFQLESSGMKRAIKTLKPTTFEDIVALLALFRPGPMENIPTYARRKKGLEKVSYVSPLLKDILASTYGIIVYQEQIIQIANKVALFPLSKADIFRQAISKKNQEKLLALKPDFIDGCLKNGVSNIEANNIYNLIERFANYGFNRSHSLSYAILATQMAYLKYHYKEEFYAAILDNTSSKDETFNMIVSEMKKVCLKLTLPNINLSSKRYLVKRNEVIFPLNQIKGILSNQVDAILLERDKNGPYLDFFDFVLRIYPYKVGQSTIVKLIDAGALDSLYPSRSSLRASLLAALMYAQNFVEYENSLGLEGVFPKPIMSKAKDDLLDNLKREYELLGIMLSGSPLTNYQEKIKHLNITPIVNISSAIGDIQIAGFIKNERKLKTKKGDNMAFVLLNDDTGECELVIFSEVYRKCYGIIKRGNIVIVEGYYNSNKETFNVINMTLLEDYQNE